MKTYYVIRFVVPGRTTGVETATLYAAFTQKGKKGRWGFSSENLYAKRFNTARMAKRVSQNAPPYKELLAEGCSWEVVEITEKVIESVAPETV